MRPPSAVTDEPAERPSIDNSALMGLAWMMAANVLFSVMTISARLASRSASWATIGASRALVGAAVAYIFALRSGASLRTKSRGLGWARSILGTLSMIATFYALSAHDLPVGDAVTIFALSPILIAIFSPMILGEKASRSLWSILLVAFFGVALVAGPHLSFASLSAASALLAAFFSALAMMFLRRLRAGSEPESAEAIAFHFAVVSFIVHALIAARSFTTPTLRDTVFIALTGLSGGLAQLAMTRAYALTEAAKLGAVSYLGTVVSFVAGVALLGERPSLMQIAGASLVIGAGTVLAIGATKDARAASTASR